MPRKTIAPKTEIEKLSILDKDGGIDEDLAPEFADDILLKAYRTMLMARRFDERRLKLQRSGRIGTFAPVNGQEAAQVGPIAAIRPDDWFVPSYRETAANIWRGADLSDLLVFDAGYNEGIKIPEDAHDLPNAVPVGTQMLQAAGIGYAAVQDGSDEVVMSFFGDGATSQGDFHEALNFASVFNCPVVFVCQNNQYAISVPRSRQTHSATIAQKALSYGMPGLQVDGNDIFATYVAAEEAVKRAREERRPTLIECVTYRQEMHTTADDPTRYREDEEVEKWLERDPLKRFEIYLAGRDLMSEERKSDLENEIDNEISEAWKQAEEKMKDLGGTAAMFAHIFETETPELTRQRERMAEGSGPAEVPHG